MIQKESVLLILNNNICVSLYTFLCYKFINMIINAENNTATIQYHVVNIFASPYFPSKVSKIEAIKGGIAIGKNPMGSLKILFEK